MRKKLFLLILIPTILMFLNSNQAGALDPGQVGGCCSYHAQCHSSAAGCYNLYPSYPYCSESQPLYCVCPWGYAWVDGVCVAHTECQNFSCVMVPTAGTNECNEDCDCKCCDSDGGDDKYVRGTITIPPGCGALGDPPGSYTEDCYDGSQVYELWCSATRPCEMVGSRRTCPSGYTCQNGRCVSSGGGTPTPTPTTPPGATPTPTPTPTPIPTPTTPSGPDLVITDVYSSGSTIYYKIRNQGSSSAVWSYSRLKVDGSQKGTESVDAITAGVTKYEYFTDYSWSCFGSQDTIQVCADVTDRVAEINENNNCRTETWTCSTTPTPTPTPTSGPTPTPTLTPTPTPTVVPTGSISGYVWEDTDTSCPIPSVPRTPVQGTTVRISPEPCGGCPTESITNASGYYEFPTVNYDVGYQLTISKPGTWGNLTCSCLDTNGADTSGGETSDICSTNVTVDSVNPNWNVDFSIVDLADGWFQVIDGDIHANGVISNPVP